MPNFVELAMKRLMQGGSHPSCEHMCLQILIAAIYYDPIILINSLQDRHNNETLFSYFIKQWLVCSNNSSMSHDRKTPIFYASHIFFDRHLG